MSKKKSPLIKPKLDDSPIMNFLLGINSNHGVLVAHKIGLFEIIHNNTLSLEQICKKLDLQKRPAEALVINCTYLGFLEKSSNGFSLTEVSKIYLLKESPFYKGMTIDFQCEAKMTADSLLKAIKTNKPQVYFDQEDIFDTHENKIEKARAFTLAMHSISMAPASFWPDNVDLSQAHRFLDIGGGSGAHTLCALKRWPHLKGELFDLKPICDIAKEILEKDGLKERITLYPGDFWKDPYPKNADIHFYSQIFHDWTFEQCKILAKKSFDTLPPGGKILLHEVLLNDDKTGPFAAAAYNIAMVYCVEGQQFSGLELKELLTSVGFVNFKITQGFTDWSIVSAQKPF